MRVTYETMYQEFLRVLEKRGFTHERAALSAKLYPMQAAMAFIHMD